MNTISAIQPAPAVVTNAGGTAAVAFQAASGAFQVLLGGLLGTSVTDAATVSSAESVKAGDSEASCEGAGVDATTASVIMTAALVAMQPRLPVAMDSPESVFAESPTTAPPIDAVAIEADTEAIDVQAVLQSLVAVEQESDGTTGEEILPGKTIAVPLQGSAIAQAKPLLESVIHAAAASIGRSTGRVFAGHRLDGPAVKGPQEGSALQAIDGNAADAAPAGFARVPVNASEDATGWQTPNNGSGGDPAGAKASTTGETAAKPLDGFKTLLGADTRPDFGPAWGASQPKSGGEIAMHEPRNAMPEPVSVREVGDVVVRSVHYLSGKSEEVVTVRLVPRSLGELQIAVRQAADGVEVVMTAANAAAREALEGHVAGLREALTRDGMDAPRVTIQVAAHFDAAHQPPLGQHGQHDATSHSPRNAPSAYRESSGSGAREREQQQPRRQGHGGRLNMWA